MVEVTVTDATVRAVDRANNVVQIETVGWDRPAPESSIPFALEATITGRATRLSLEATSVSAGMVDGDGRIVDRDHLDANDRLELSSTEQGVSGLVWVTGPINTWIGFDADAVVEKRGDDDLVVSFSYPTAVTLGFRSNVDAPSRTITVPETPAGVATAISQFSASFTETSPQRTSLLFRGHPPEITFGDDTAIPEQIRTATTPDVELHLPERLDALFPAASLATYIGADVHVERGARPTVRLPDAGVSHELPAPPAFQYEAAKLLRRTFFLDMLVRWVTESEFDWFESDALSVLDLDPSRCADLPMADRIERYLSVDFERVSPIFPEWTSSVYVEPTYESARALPFLVTDLSQLYLPSARPDRSESTPQAGHGPRPRTRGPYVGWLGDDPLADTYRAHLDAYRNRSAYLGDPEEISVAVVVADPDWEGRESVVGEYRVDDPSIDLSVYDDPTRSDLVDAVAGGVDLLHYVGDYRDGFDCTDGRVSPAAFGEANVRTFFLDGPDSDEAARELVSAGSVAGAVRSGDHEGAPNPLTRNFLRLLVDGLTFDLAGRYARHFSDGGGSLTVVGDGLHEFVTYDQLQVFPMELDPVGDGQFRVRIPCWYTNVGLGFGGLCLDRWHFGGNEFDLTLDAGDVTQLLDTRQYAVIYDDEIYRSNELTPFDPLV